MNLNVEPPDSAFMPTRAVKKEYVLGFCFLQFCNDVVLIRKNKPEWQKGLLNGVGGKIESGESPLDAMRREWKEETGTVIQDWQHFVTMSFSGAVVHVFKCQWEGWLNVNTVTDEPVGIFSVRHVLAGEFVIIPNLKWLIPMALYDSQIHQSHWKGAPILNYP